MAVISLNCRYLLVPKMLRVVNSAHEPLHSPRTPKSPNAEVLRKQIVGLLNEDQGKENNRPVKIQTPQIYQIQRKGGTSTILKPSDKNERQIERIKRSHLRFIREANNSRSKEFPSIENYVLHGEAKDTGRNQEFDDPTKRHWALPGDLKQESKVKNVRFHIQEEKKNQKSQEENESKDRERESIGLFCEIRGSAIPTSNKSGRLIKPSPRQRRAEATKRQATIHTSLQLFKRRLKLNHETYITPSITANHDNDYIIRRVPMKNGTNTVIPVPRASSAAKPIIEPRLSINTTQRPKSSVGPSLHVQKTFLKTRPQSSPERNLTRPRLQENMHNTDMNLFPEEEEQEAIATVVNTYYVEPNKPKPEQFHQSSLSMHNLDVHNSLNVCSDARMRLTNSNMQFDNRFLRWLEESSANSEEARRASMKVHHEQLPATESPKSPIFPDDHNETEL